MPENRLVLVVGATGGVGQLTVAKLLAKNYRVRILTRSETKAKRLFANQVQISVGDIKDTQSISKAIKSVTDVICCVGTTAFPSSKWQLNLSNPWDYLRTYLNPKKLGEKANNSPLQIDAEGVINLVKNCAQNQIQRFVLVSSCGVLRVNQFPYTILNLFGVLDAKKRGEDYLINSDIPYTIIRPSRLIDGPFTSYDLNTLLQAKTKVEQGVVIDTGDKISGQSSRIDVANACVECLSSEKTKNKAFEIINQGEREKPLNWQKLWDNLS
jgi:uncharacterized protein YbjT (DUF2867 family)